MRQKALLLSQAHLYNNSNDCHNSISIKYYKIIDYRSMHHVTHILESINVVIEYIEHIQDSDPFCAIPYSLPYGSFTRLIPIVENAAIFREYDLMLHLESYRLSQQHKRSVPTLWQQRTQTLFLQKAPTLHRQYR